jgi:2-haloacid dehalogenase
VGLADPSHFDAMSFDCYGTLIDWETGILTTLRPWARSQGLQLDDEALLAAFSRHEGRIQKERPGAPYPEVLAQTFRSIGREVGGEVTDAEAGAFGSSVGSWPAFPDSRDALAALARRYRLIIVSNVDRRSFARSNQQLGVTFAAIITAEDVGSYKPAPAHFHALLRKLADLGVARERLVHVAQSLFHDHVPAKAAGLPTIWINRRAGRPGWGATPPPAALVHPDWEFPSMAALAAAAGCAAPGLSQ